MEDILDEAACDETVGVVNVGPIDLCVFLADVEDTVDERERDESDEDEEPTRCFMFGLVTDESGG